MVTKYDVVIVGGGIVGLATGLALLEEHPSLALLVLEKECELGAHQSGHNSGVIHSGVYYPSGSLKARLCVKGARRMEEFCQRHGIHYYTCGKVIVATTDAELIGLEELYHRGAANHVWGLRKITAKELQQIEPHAAGVAALHIPGTGIVDYREVVDAMAGDLRRKGAVILTNVEVIRVSQDRPNLLRVVTAGEEINARFLINCAGLYSDEVARRAGVAPDIHIIPFRGEYYTLRPERVDLVRGLIYPVPDSRFPFLGVHFTRKIHGGVEAGPNAVLAFAREGYSWHRVHIKELLATLRFPGFWSMARHYSTTGIAEYYRSFSRPAFARALQTLVPDVREEDLVPGGAGVRAQAVAPDGTLVDDFRIFEDKLAIHVLNAPSPGATASIAIGEYIAKRVDGALREVG